MNHCHMVLENKKAVITDIITAIDNVFLIEMLEDYDIYCIMKLLGQKKMMFAET